MFVDITKVVVVRLYGRKSKTIDSCKFWSRIQVMRKFNTINSLQ
jgi:hypothetical protein